MDKQQMPARGGSVFGGKIFIGGDHTGYELKKTIKEYLNNLALGYEVVDMGAQEYNKDDDYPDFIRPVAEAVAQDKESLGIILGGSGQGEAMCANRIKGVRAVVFYGEAIAKEAIDIKGATSTDPFEIIKLARAHNDANVLSLGVRFISPDEAKKVLELFLTTEFSSDESHVRRLGKF